MPTYRDEAIVLRTQKLGSRIASSLCSHAGWARCARSGAGCARPKSKFGARLEPAMVIDVQCYEGRSLDTVTQTESIDPLGDRLARGIETWTAASVMLETCDRLTEEREPALQQFLLLRGALTSLAGVVHDPNLVPTPTYYGRWRSPAMPRVSTTARNAARRAHIWPSTSWPGFGVSAVSAAGGSGPRDPRSAVGAAHRRLGDRGRFGSAPSTRGCRSGRGLPQWHLERGLRSLRMVER